MSGARVPAALGDAQVQLIVRTDGVSCSPCVRGPWRCGLSGDSQGRMATPA